eukprot:TRINITY_DN11691_c0_g5_i2.p1 TRINITY_DN11691_c0_g5~~TRINITY_DN11691_c0_g5_i2.p1  ORF type:complete len:103 (-),score=10.17 TRINITY_DN11691_c0_g5_i2:201-509(-)
MTSPNTSFEDAWCATPGAHVYMSRRSCAHVQAPARMLQGNKGELRVLRSLLQAEYPQVITRMVLIPQLWYLLRGAICTDRPSRPGDLTLLDNPGLIGRARKH